MTKKEAFIKVIEKFFGNPEYQYDYDNDEEFDLAKEFFEDLKSNKDKSKSAITENGAKILILMQNNREKYNNVFKAKDIAEELFVSSRSVSGSMRKLISDGFVEKIGQDPVTYAIAEKGITADVAGMVELKD